MDGKMVEAMATLHKVPIYHMEQHAHELTYVPPGFLIADATTGNDSVMGLRACVMSKNTLPDFEAYSFFHEFVKNKFLHVPCPSPIMFKSKVHAKVTASELSIQLACSAPACIVIISFIVVHMAIAAVVSILFMMVSRCLLMMCRKVRADDDEGDSCGESNHAEVAGVAYTLQGLS